MTRTMIEIPLAIKQEYDRLKPVFPKACIVYDANKESYFVSVCTIEFWTKSLFLKKVL